jgi:hypothetical protein
MDSCSLWTGMITDNETKRGWLQEDRVSGGHVRRREHRNFPGANMSRMTVVAYCPTPGPAATALVSALRAALGSVHGAATAEDAEATCGSNARAVLVLDLRGDEAAAAHVARRLRRRLPATAMLALVGPGTPLPPLCDGVLTMPFYLTDVVAWCLRAAQAPLADAVLPDIVAGLSHEVGNALTALQLQVELLESDAVDPPLRGHLDQIAQASRRIEAVVSDVRGSSERPPVQAGPTRLAALVKDAATAVVGRAPALRGRIDLRCRDESVRVEQPLLCGALADVWEYLLLAGESGDRLRVRAGPRDDDTLAITAVARVPRLPGDAAERLFTPLWARQALGLSAGLSLSAARAAFRRHSGDLCAATRGPGNLSVEALLPRDRPSGPRP